MTLEEKIKNQIPDELYLILTKTLPSERSQKKQLEIAQKAIKQLDVEDFTPYIGYEDDGDIYVCMKHRLNGYELETIHASGKHDVSFGEDGIWIEHDLMAKYETIQRDNEWANWKKELDEKEYKEEVQARKEAEAAMDREIAEAQKEAEAAMDREIAEAQKEAEAAMDREIAEAQKAQLEEERKYIPNIYI